MLNETEFLLEKQKIDDNGYNNINDNLLAAALYIDHHYMTNYLKNLDNNINQCSQQTNNEVPVSAHNHNFEVYDNDEDEGFVLQTGCNTENLLKDALINNTSFKDLCTAYPNLLHIAVSEGDIYSVKRLLDRGIDIKYLDEFNRSALDIAINNSHISIATLLLKSGENTFLSNLDNGTLVSCWAARYNNEEMVLWLIEHNKELLRSRDSDNYTPLYMAVKNNNLSIVNAILAELNNIPNIIEEKYDYGSTLLWKAAEMNNVNIVQSLINYGANIESINDYNTTPLQIAFKKDSLLSAKVLIFNGAKIDVKSIKDVSGNNLLHLCCIHENMEDLYLFLIDQSQNIDLLTNVNQNGKSIYDLALLYKRSKILEDIWYNKDKVKVCKLHDFYKFEENILDDKKLEVNDILHDKDGNHLLAKDPKTKELSKIYNFVNWRISIEEAINVLDINKTNHNGNTLLYELIKKVCYSDDDARLKVIYIKEVLKYGIDINKTNRSNGYTPLELANLSGHHQIAELLSKHNAPEDTMGNGSGNYESPSYWNQYSQIGITELLELRIKDLGVLEKVKMLTSDVVWSGDREKGNILVKTIIEFLGHEERIAVMPLNLYYKHWVGMVIRKDDHGVSLTYLDSENNPIPVKLEVTLKDQLKNVGYDIDINSVRVEQQVSNNCGPEVIENIILYLTGIRLQQDKAVEYHSYLLEQKLIFEAKNISDEEQEPLCFKGDKNSAIPQPIGSVGFDLMNTSNILYTDGEIDTYIEWQDQDDITNMMGLNDLLIESNIDINF
jgi:ankyrin repeat protein